MNSQNEELGQHNFLNIPRINMRKEENKIWLKNNIYFCASKLAVNRNKVNKLEVRRIYNSEKSKSGIAVQEEV